MYAFKVLEEKIHQWVDEYHPNGEAQLSLTKILQELEAQVREDRRYDLRHLASRGPGWENL